MFSNIPSKKARNFNIGQQQLRPESVLETTVNHLSTFMIPLLHSVLEPRNKQNESEHWVYKVVEKSSSRRDNIQREFVDLPFEKSTSGGWWGTERKREEDSLDKPIELSSFRSYATPSDVTRCLRHSFGKFQWPSWV